MLTDYFDFFLKSFMALFVAIDVLGAVPFVISLTKTLSDRERKLIIYRATIAAFVIGVIFVFLGRKVFAFVGITEGDFKVAGGLLLLLFAIRDLMITSSHQGANTPTKVGIVPIAIPLMMGPASLTTLMVGAEQFGLSIVLLSLFLNLVVVLFVFLNSKLISNWMGEEAGDAFNKVFSLLLAAIGVMFIRSGIFEMLK